MKKALVFEALGLELSAYAARLRNMIQRMNPGQLLHVIASDPHSEDFIESYCRYSGDQILESEAGCNGRRIFLTIEKQP